MLINQSNKNAVQISPTNNQTPLSKRKSLSCHSNLKIKHNNVPPSTYQSVSSLQRSIQAISFTKASRSNINPLNYDDSSSSIFTSSPFDYKNKRSTSFGYGQKQCIPPSILRNAKDLPGANTYKIPSQFDSLIKGKTFGMSRDCFEKTYLPGIDQMPIGVARELPGPGQYDIKNMKRNGGFSLVGKGNSFNKYTKDDGPFMIYQPNMEFVEAGRFKKIGFGIGKRGEHLRRKEPGPGPGTYEFVGIFQKYDKKYKAY